MRQSPSSQRGVNLISLMIALTIGAFLLAGLFQVWFQTRQTFSAQGQLSLLQDNERMALTIMANTVQTGGYYPIYLNYQVPAPTTPYSQTGSLPVTGDYTVAGQSIFGTGTASQTGTGDTLEVRFVADSNTLDCLGQSEATGSLVVNTYSIGTGTSANQLQCTVNVTPLTGTKPAPVTSTIVTGVTNLSVLYNTVTSGTTPTYQYMSASAVASSGVGWINASTGTSNIQSAKITLIFNNPLSGQPGQPSTLPPISRVVALTQTLL